MYKLLSIIIAIFISACSESPTNIVTVNTPPNDTTDDKIVVLTDRTGKKWDISYAFNHYQMDPSQFYYGLGPNAITPIQNPKFFNSGDQGRPTNTNNNVVIGVNYRGEQRAYPLYVLKSHEIVNDDFSGVPVAVVY